LIEILQGSSVGLDRAIKKLRVYWGRKVLADKSNSENQSDCCTESDFEQASGISKRQVEKKIHEIAKKVDRVWQVDKSVVEKYSGIKATPLVEKHSTTPLSTNKLNFHPKTPNVLPQNLLKENLTQDEDKDDRSLLCIEDTSDKYDDNENLCHPPPKKWLKLTKTQSLPVMT